MRLVRDDDDVMLEQEAEPQEQEATAPVPTTLRMTTEERPDGVVDENEADDSSEAADGSVDLDVLEALLFGTHHPLTAGRLAELMELETTKPVRRAIKELNEQY